MGAVDVMRDWEIVRYQPVSVDWYLADLPEIRSVLDIGCGDGDVLRAWADRGVRTYALDKDKRILTKKYMPKETVCFCQDWERWKPAAGFMVDGVYSSLGPDVSSPEQLQRLSLLARKWVRIVMAAAGSSTLLDAARAHWDAATPVYEVDSVRQRLVYLGYMPSITYADATCEWRTSACAAAVYLARQVQADIREVRSWLEQYVIQGTAEQVEACSRITYARITWEVGETR